MDYFFFQKEIEINTFFVHFFMYISDYLKFILDIHVKIAQSMKEKPLTYRSIASTCSFKNSIFLEFSMIESHW